MDLIRPPRTKRSTGADEIAARMAAGQAQPHRPKFRRRLADSRRRVERMVPLRVRPVEFVPLLDRVLVLI
jgi:hypothetical protein